eukprot:4387598-Pyramimonas_sp.AAC.1
MGRLGDLSAVPGAFSGASGASEHPPGASWEPLVAPLGVGSLVGAPRGPPGAVLGPLGVSLGASDAFSGQEMTINGENAFASSSRPGGPKVASEQRQRRAAKRAD